MSPSEERIDKLTTGIDGFDLVSNGGLPRGRSTLLSGTAGSAKTVFADAVPGRGRRPRRARRLRHLRGDACRPPPQHARLRLGPRRLEAERKLAFVDAVAPARRGARSRPAPYDFGALVARIEAAVRKVARHAGRPRLARRDLRAVPATRPASAGSCTASAPRSSGSA